MTKLRTGFAFTLLALLTALLIGWNLQHLATSTATQPGMAALLWSQSYLPRIMVALLAGAALGLCGLLAQLVLKNPLAEPATLGIASGLSWAQLLPYSRVSRLGSRRVLRWREALSLPL